MAFLKFSPGVVVPRVTIIAVAFINSVNEIGAALPANTAWVTSGNDRQHRHDSKHYTNEALDFRTKTFTSADKRKLITALKARLGRHYDVILEAEGGTNEHLHVEYDPKD